MISGFYTSDMRKNNLQKAGQLHKRYGKISNPFLQCKLKISYKEAEKIMKEIEKNESLQEVYAQATH